MKNSMSEAEKISIIDDTNTLKKQQEQVEDLSCLPSLKVEDIPEKQK